MAAVCVGTFVTRFVLSSNRIVRQLVKFFVRNGMKGIVVKLKPYTAKLQVSVNDELHPTSCCTHTMQLLQPDVVTAMQDDLVAQLTTVSAMASVAGSAFGSLGRSLTL